MIFVHRWNFSVGEHEVSYISQHAGYQDAITDASNDVDDEGVTIDSCAYEGTLWSIVTGLNIENSNTVLCHYSTRFGAISKLTVYPNTYVEITSGIPVVSRTTCLDNLVVRRDSS